MLARSVPGVLPYHRMYLMKEMPQCVECAKPRPSPKCLFYRPQTYCYCFSSTSSVGTGGPLGALFETEHDSNTLLGFSGTCGKIGEVGGCM